MNTQIPFIENTGQTSSEVEYYADTLYGTAYITDNSILHSITGENNTNLVIKEEFRDKNGQVITFHPTGLEKGNVKVDFYLGDDPSQWSAGQTTWNTISLGELYPGISVLLKANGGNVEKIFQITPGANPDDIKIRVTGADGLNIDEEGNLNLQSSLGTVQLSKPTAYQGEQNIDATYTLSGNTYQFQMGNYDQKHLLIIDPILEYSSYIGGSDYDDAQCITRDGSGNIYISGTTYSTNFPTTTGAFQTSFHGYNDIIISKLALNSGGAADLLYSTYLGGSDDDYVKDITLDNGGNIYITGYTESHDFPTTPGAYDTTQNAYTKAIICKLTPNGGGTADLLYSTYIGAYFYSLGYNEGHGIAVDSSGNIYITGSTQAPNFPTTTGAYQTSNHGGTDVIICKLAPNGGGAADLLYSTYLGGSGHENGNDIALDNNSNVYITGYTYSTDFPTKKGVYQTSNQGDADIFISKLALNGGGSADLLKSTYFGGTAAENGLAIALKWDISSTYVYITGYTESTDFPTTSGAFQTINHGGKDAFMVNIGSNLGASELLYSTYLGGTDGDEGHCIAVDQRDNIYITGGTFSDDFPTTDRTNNNGWEDAFICKIKPLGGGTSDLKYSTYLGGSDFDTGYGVFNGNNGIVYIAGCTKSTNFPTTTGAYQTTNNGYYDAFIVKLDTKELHVFPGQSIQNAIDSAGSDYTIVVHGNSGSPYTYSENLTIDRSLIMHSADDGAVTISALNNNQPVINITSSGSYSTINGFIISNAIHSSGISLESANNCQILSNTISYNNVGVKLYDSPSNYIQSNSIINNGWTGICLDNSSNNTINGSNNITGNQDGIFIANNSSNNGISENNIHNNTGMGISILNSSNGNNVSSNTAISQNGVMGVFLQNASSNTILGNTIQDNGWTGICLDHATGNLILGSNVIFENVEGIFLANSSTGNTIQGNNIHDNNGVGINILGSSDNTQILYNTAISNNGVMGVFIQNSNTNTISGNNIQNNGWSGICMDNATENSINSANIITGNHEGVFLANSSNENYIEHNTINYNNGNGISVLNSYTNTIASNTQINNNSASGIFLQNSSENFICQNSIQSNIWAGICLDTCYDTQVYSNNFISNPEQALAVNGTGNTFYQGTSGNYWSDWTPKTDPRPIDGNENIYDQYPSTTPFLI